jgi:preprotein translocase subunit Sss1
MVFFLELNPIKRLKRFNSDARHIMSVSYRPDMDTFKRTLKIVLLGILIMGILAFIISGVISLIVYS